MSLAASPPSSRRLTRLLEASAGGRVGRNLPPRSLVFDALVVVMLVAVGELLLQVLSPRARAQDFWFVVLVTVPLIGRRRLPKAALLVTFAVGVVQMLLHVKVGLYDAALLFALYSAVGYTNRRFGLTSLAVAGVAVVVGALTGWWVYVDRQLGTPDPLLRLATAAGAAVLVLATWALGERLRSARLGLISLADRAEQLEREREQQAQLAAAAERARIAREMHDVVAHGLSVMIVQADGAAYVVEESPAMAKQALERIAATGRESLAEMRNLLGLLRAGSAVVPGAEAVLPGPQPDLADLHVLIGKARAAGAAVEVSVEGAVDQVPTMVSLTAYRIVQEALTNARKHGGDAVSVQLTAAPDGVRVQVRDDGRAETGTSSGPPGFGLVGMRERVAAVNGELTAAPYEDGYEVTAWLPYHADAETAGRQE